MGVVMWVFVDSHKGYIVCSQAWILRTKFLGGFSGEN